MPFVSPIKLPLCLTFTTGSALGEGDLFGLPSFLSFSLPLFLSPLFVYLLSWQRQKYITPNSEISISVWGASQIHSRGHQFELAQKVEVGFSFFFFLSFSLLLLFFLPVLDPRCCAWAFSSCCKYGPLCIAACRLLIVVASFVVEHRFQGSWASVFMARGPRSCSSGAPELGLSSCGTWT